MGRKKISNLNEEFDLKLFAIIARKNFYLLFINITIFLTLSYLYLRYTHPVYISETVLKIGTVNNANAVLNLQNNQFMDAMGSSNQLAGDIELLRSRVMIARVIARMQMNVSYFSQEMYSIMRCTIIHLFQSNIRCRIPVFSIPVSFFISIHKNSSR
ncbi:MAG: hypothetical protein IPO49_08355 [Bacteroidetes bacterium]|nr:hypothetical protein [Bacteroidota bacterium]